MIVNILRFFLATVLMFLVTGTILPQKVTNASEVTLRGIVKMEVVEQTIEEPSFRRFFIQKFDGKDLRLIYLRGEVDFAALLDKEVTILGIDSGNATSNRTFMITKVVAVEETKREAIASTLGPLQLPPPTRGFSRNVLVQPIMIENNPTPQFTPSQAKGWMFTNQKSIKNWVKENSFNQFDIKGVIDPTGDVANWVTVPFIAANCIDWMANEGRIAADNQAETQGFSKQAYQTRFHIYRNIPGCNASASAFVGTFGDNTRVEYVFIHLPANFAENTNVFNLFFTALIHELLHNLGISAHSNGEPFEGAPALQYGDNGDPMGTNNRPIFVSNVNRLKLGWLNHSQFVVIETRGTHNLFLQTPAVSTKGIGPNSPPVGIIIPIRSANGSLTGNVLVLERRRNFGFWDQFSTDVQAYPGGVSARRINANFANSHNGPIILNSKPQSILGCCTVAPVLTGETWTIVSANVTIEPGFGTPQRMPIRLILGNNYPL